MKQCFSLILTFLLFFSLCACDGSDTGKKVDVISEEELAQYSEYVELTMENWEEFFEVEKREVVTTDAFGEEIERYISTALVLKEGIYISEDNGVRIKFNCDIGGDNLIEMTQDIVFRDNMNYGEEIAVRGSILHPNLTGDVILEKIKGTVLRLSIPEEKWNVDESGNKLIIVKGDNREYSIYYNVITFAYP
ncbi:MAG: hypothetical protein E7558_07755 [Ruminococcaceae bacterium]|nr:hypothetical protein [Oscillospiraceae bacterium]